MKLSRNKINGYINGVGLSLILAVCFLYSFYGAEFAELHVQYPFFDFPVFVGEYLFLFSLLLLILKWHREKLNITQWHYVLMVYFFWILGRAAWGYFNNGPLALRTSAMFYYQFFAVFSFYFFHKKQFNHQYNFTLMIALWPVLFFSKIETYYWIAYFFLFIILVLIQKTKWAKNLGFLLITLLFVSDFNYLFWGSRSHFVGVSSVFLYLIFIGLVFLPKKFNHWTKLALGIFILIIFVSLTRILTDKNAYMSLTTPKSLLRGLVYYETYIKRHETDFKFGEFEVNLYNKNAKQYLDRPFERYIDPNINKIEMKRRGMVQIMPEGMAKSLPKELVRILPNIQSSKRDLQVAYNNIIFRLLIWRDMIEEVIDERALFGVSFGKPQRSKSIEILNWAEGEWRRDGWITPHNSLLHIIYRAGIFGIAFIGIIMWIIVRMTKKFIQRKSLIGVLFVGVLIYWLVLSNFLVVLEVPYYAIPFWTFFGLTFANYHNMLRVRRYENTSRS